MKCQGNLKLPELSGLTVSHAKVSTVVREDIGNVTDDAVIQITR